MTTLKGKPDTRTDATMDGGAKEFGGDQRVLLRYAVFL